MDLGDHTERAFRTDVEPCQVVSRRRLAGTPAGPHDPSVGQNHGQTQDVFAHRAVAHRIRATRSRGGHATQRRVGAGIDRKEKPGIAEIGVQLLARDTRLNAAVQVFAIHLQDRIHLA